MDTTKLRSAPPPGSPTPAPSQPGAASSPRPSPRVDAMIAWLMKHQSRIEAMEKGAVTFNVGGGSISVKLEHVFSNVN